MSKDNDMPNDEKLTTLYRQADHEQPPAQLDEAILAAARRESNSRPHPAYSPFSRNWRVPVSLAAVLVLSISLVSLMDDEIQPVFDESGVLLSEIDGYAPAISEAERTRPDDKKRKAEMEQQPASRAVSPLEKSRVTAEQRARPARSGDVGEAQLATRPTVAAKPAKVEPASAPEDVAIEEGVLARKRKPAMMADSISSTGVVGRVMTIPTVEDITALREAGKLEQAGLSADSFMLHYFGDDLDKVDPMKVQLESSQWEAIIVELRLLDRKEESEKIEDLLKQKQNPAGH